MRIDQIVVGATPGDAITESALRLREALRSVVTSELYAAHPPGRLEGDVRALADFPAGGSADDLVLLHVSIGQSDILDFALRRPERVVLVYHNITPARYFDEIDSHFASLLRGGRAQLRLLVERADGALADSDFNATELRSLGLEDVHVAPPPLNLQRLHEVEPDPSMTARLDALGGPVIAWVGQMLPHKRPDLAVDALHLLNVNHVSNAHLVMAGPHRNHRYLGALVRHIHSLNLPTAHILGEISDAELGTLYRRADAMVISSEHEGFCVPIVEAFSFGVPVVARDFGAMSETSGGAALVSPSAATAPELAESMAIVLSDDEVATEMRRRGFARAEEFSQERTLAVSLAALARTIRDLPARIPA